MELSADYYKQKEEFDTESNQLLNMMCDTFHDELQIMVKKYGTINVSIKIVNNK